MSVVRRSLIGPFALIVLANTAVAQDPRLSARLDKSTLGSVSAIVDSARVAGLPTAPLVDKALEGSAKGSDPGNITSAVHQLFVRMGSAKRAIGPKATADEIKSASDALDAGVSARDLARLRAASGKRQVTMPLAVLSDLIGRKVPVATATDLVVQLAKSGLKDPEFALFQRNVRADIDRGADPTVAATTRARGLILRTGSETKPSE
jgi:hypothetical protein